MDDAVASFRRAYPALPESVPRARAELTEFARRAGASADCVDAVRLAASEAVTNAVLHAYPPGPACEHPIQVCASFVEDGLSVLVADDGGGLRPPSHQTGGLGLGLVIIARLADDFQLVSRGSGGTELRMGFKLAAGKYGAERQERGSLSAAASRA
jgi:anti-sigma regulatory factor (Ser/Thr protein kinase)